MFDGRFRKGVDWAVKPVGQSLRRTGLSPDHFTTLGLLVAVPTAWAIGTGRLGLGLALLIFSALPDLIDGALAKAAGRATVRGAFFDSVCDRVTDALVLGGMAWYLQDHHHGHAFMLPFAVLGVSLLISYERAKAESLGFDAKGGIMERAERIVVLCAGLAFSFLLVPLLWVMLALTSLTAIQRFVKVWRQATAFDRAAAEARAASPNPAPEASPPPSSPPADVAARWRAWRQANGWQPRPTHFEADAGSAVSARHLRRQARVARREQLLRERLEGQDDAQGADVPPWRRRSAPRRP